MYSVWKNAKCIKLFKTYKGAHRRFLQVYKTSNVENDIIELFYNGNLLHTNI